MMTITANKGFQMKFDNGLTISCQMGYGNYCNNRNFDKSMELMGEMKQDSTRSSNCEVAIWDEDDNWITEEIFAELGLGELPDTVAGWIDTMTVAKLIAYVSTR